MILALWLLATGAPAREVRLVMGTTAEVWAEGLAEPAAALDQAFAALGLVDNQMSLWKQSDLTRLNRAGHARVPPELAAVLRHALDVAAASGGAFDASVEPLVRAAGGLGGKAQRLTPAARKRLLARVGSAHVHLAPDDQVRLDPGTALDFGGIAKGFAVDLAVAALRRAGASAGFVDLGGSSLGLFGEPMRLDVRNPEEPGGRAWVRFRISEGHVATSGGDQKPGHILDPRTGLPAKRVLSATVVARSGIEADALATAVFVLGADEGLALLARRGAEGIVLLRAGQRRLARITPGLAEAHDLETEQGVMLWP